MLAVGHPAVAVLLGLGAAGLGALVVAMAWNIHVRQFRLAELLARRQFTGTADPRPAGSAANGNNDTEAALQEAAGAGGPTESGGPDGIRRPNPIRRPDPIRWPDPIQWPDPIRRQGDRLAGRRRGAGHGGHRRASALPGEAVRGRHGGVVGGRRRRGVAVP